MISQESTTKDVKLVGCSVMLKEIAMLVYNASLRPYDKLSFTRMCFENSEVAEIQKLFFFFCYLKWTEECNGFLIIFF